MTNNYDLDDLARLHALEHIVSAIALMWSVNFAQNNQSTPSICIAELRASLNGSLLDSKERTMEFRDLTRTHLDRPFDSISQMARHADLGFEK